MDTFDILNPPLMWIGNRCYRVHPSRESDDLIPPNCREQEKQQYIEEDLYGEDDDVGCNADDGGGGASEENSDSYDIQYLADSNRYKCVFHVPNVFYAIIIGAKCVTKKRIEVETKTTIKVPKAGTHIGDIEVIGASRQNVCSARRRIELVVLGARHKQECTHFLSVPVSRPAIIESFNKFKNEILNGHPIYGLEESMFQNCNKLHITFGILSLMDNVDRLLASKLLQDCQSTIIKSIVDLNGPIEMKMTGVEYMNDDPSEVDVLYGKIECKFLQEIADQMVDHFVTNGLMQRQYEHVKIHVTLINSIFRQKKMENVDHNINNSQQGRNNKKNNQQRSNRQTFDARQILEKYSNYSFGKQPLKEIHLSRRHTTSYADGYYDASSILKVLH